MTKPLTKTPLEVDTLELLGAMNSCNIESCLKYNHHLQNKFHFLLTIQTIRTVLKV